MNSESAIQESDAVDLAIGGCSLIQLVRRGGESFVEKRLLPKFQARKQYERLIQNEFELLSGLRHPLIIEADSLSEVEIFHSKKTFVLRMPYVKGPSLSSWLADLKDQALDFRRLQSRRLLYQFCSVYKHLHSDREVVHGDVAPDNILIDERGLIRLIDFGLSFRAEDGPSKDFAVGGRTSFRAPEVLEGNPPSYASDIFALGRIFEEALGRSALTEDRKWLSMMIEERKLPERREILEDVGDDPSLDTMGWRPEHRPQNHTPTLVEALPRPRRVWAFGLALFTFVALSSYCPTAALRINTLPPTEVYIDGESFGETPVSHLELPSGGYRLEFYRADFQAPVSKEIQLSPGSVLNVFEDFRNIDNLE